MVADVVVRWAVSVAAFALSVGAVVAGLRWLGRSARGAWDGGQ